MISNVYSLHDSKALTYSPPFLAAQHGLAIRMVMEIADGPSTSVGRHPADFTLYCIGRFDDQSGQMLPAEHREHISDVVSLLPRSPVTAGLFEDAPRTDYFANQSKPANGEVK